MRRDCFRYLSFLKNKVVPFYFLQLKKEIYIKYLKIYKPNYIFYQILFFKNLMNIDVSRILAWQILVKNPLNIKLHKNLALLLATSGSTGNSKIVKISYENINENTIQISKYLSLNAITKTITTLPINYTYGMSVLNTFFYSKSKMIITK